MECGQIWPPPTANPDLGRRWGAVDAHRLDICGTDELPAALSALDSADVDSEEDAARS